MPSGDSTSGFALAAILGGVVFLFAGVKGVSVLKAIQAVIQGKNPATVAPTQQIAASGGPLAASTDAAVTSSGGPAPVVSGGTYNTAQLKQLWQAAGGSAASATNAACHAMQESSGRASVTSSNPDGGINVGLWQLDTKGVGAGHTVAQLQDPMTNAQITVKATGDGANWSEWATPGC
jgi:Lysozyme like domain